MTGTLKTPLLYSHVIMETLFREMTQQLVKHLETGVIQYPHVLVMNKTRFFILFQQTYKTRMPLIGWMCSAEFINITVTCSPFGSILHGSVSYDTDPEDDWYSLNTRATFTCDSGFTQCGDPLATCQTSGRWSELTPPTCRGNNLKIFFKNAITF